MEGNQQKEDSNFTLTDIEELAVAILDTLTDPVMVIDSGNTIIYVNQSFTDATGFSAAELRGAKPPFPFWPREHAGENIPDYCRRSEVLFYPKSGARFRVPLSVKQIEGNNHSLYHIISWVNNPANKKEEEAARRSGVFMSRIVEYAPNPVLVANLDSSIEYVNPALESLTGYTSAELVGKNAPYPWWPPEMIEQFLHEDVIGRHLKAVTRQERLYMKKSGEMFWVNITIATIRESGKTRYFLSNWVDITEHKRVMDSIKESSEYSSSILINSPNPILVYDPDASIRYVNPAFEKLTGFSAHELIGVKPPFPWWPEEHRRQRGQMLIQSLQSDVMRAERIVRSKSGEYLTVDITRSTVRDSTGNCKFNISIWVDITEQIRMRRNLEFYAEQITRAQEEERKRIARELHDDTAQALSLLGLEIESIGRKNDLHREALPGIMEDLRNKVSRVLNDVRRFSHELRPDLLDHLGLIMAVENMVDEMGQVNQIETGFEVLGDEYRLSGERELLIFRIIQESLNNIRKHAQAKVVKVKVKFKPERVLILIADNGKGFDVSRVMNELANRKNLGLLGMRERVRLMGGRLSILSRTQQGTMIFVSVPSKSREMNGDQAGAVNTG